jgi:hypothetical protein
MGHQLAQGNRLMKRIRRVKIGKVASDRGVKVESALLDQLHDGHVREQLGNRANPVDRVGRGRNLGLEIGEAKAFCPDDFLVVHQGNREGR